MLKSLSEQADVAFVAEGEPLVSLLSEEQAGKLAVRRMHFTEAVEQIAAAFDYTVTRHKNIVILKKRYTEPNDLPGVTLEECRLAVHDVIKLLTPWLINMDEIGEPVRRFAATLTDDQLRLMPRQMGGLPVSSLNPQQRAIVWNISLFFYVQKPEVDIRMIPAQIDLVLNKKTTFGWSHQHGMRLFGYEGTLVTSRGPYNYFRPLSHTGRVFTLASGGVGFITRSNSVQKSDVAPVLPSEDAYEDPTDPASQSKESKRATESVAITMKAVVATLQTRTGPSLKVEVDDTLAAKPVTIVGAERAAPEAILRSLADVYGLRVRAEDDGTLRLTRRLPRPPKDIAGLPEALRNVFPEPLLHALHADDVDRLQKEAAQEQHRQAARKLAVDAATREGRAVDPSGEIEYYKKALHRDMMSQKWGAAPASLRTAAARRLRALVEPKLKDAEGGRVPSGSLGEPERMALANVLMADCLQAMRLILSNDPPDYIRSFDRTILVGGVDENPGGNRKFALFLRQPPHPDGAVYFRGAGLIVDYPKK